MSAPTTQELCRPRADWLEDRWLSPLSVARGGQSRKSDLRNKGGLVSG